MGIELFLIAAGLSILLGVIGRRRFLDHRFAKNKEALAKIRFEETVPAEVEKFLIKAPLLKGDGKFAFKVVGCIPFAKNFETVRLARRIYFVEPTLIEVLLIPDPGNLERKLGVAVTIDSKILGYVPAQEAGEMHRFLLTRSTGLRAKAKIFIGSRPEYNAIMLDLAKPLRLETRKG